MGKKATVNGFTEGLSMDLNELTDTKETLIDALNATLVTGNGNEMILLNDDGNVKIIYTDSEGNQLEVCLKENYIPVGIKEYGGIIYIASMHILLNKDNDCEIGCFPSPEYAIDINRNFSSGKLLYKYSPLHNLKTPNGISDLNTPFFRFNLQHPVTIDCLKSYDNSVNLIINDGINIPRLINTGFAVTSSTTYTIPERTNPNTRIYLGDTEDNFNITTSLIKRYKKIPTILFNGVLNNGSLKVGNYVFYFKYADADGNETDIVAESGIVSCFLGNNADPSSINGGFRDNNSNKSVLFTLTNLDDGYDYIRISYSRNTSDLDLNRVTSVTIIDLNFLITGDSDNRVCNVIISGSEKTKSSTIDELNQQYTILNSVKTETQNNNILFSANVSISDSKYLELTALSLKILPYAYEVDSKSKIGEISDSTYTDISNIVENAENDKLHNYKGEYYNVKNIYYNLGYWPEEFYRFGIVYIFKDGSLSPVYNVRGCDNLPYHIKDSSNWDDIKDWYDINTYNKLYQNIYISNGNSLSRGLLNNKGVIRIKKDGLKIVRQLYGVGFLNTNNLEDYKKLGVKGFFYVRQKRLPTILCLAYLMPNDNNSNLPTIYRYRYSDKGTDESPSSPFYCNNGSTLDIKKYRLNLVGESFLWYGGNEWNLKNDDLATEFQYKNDKPNYYIKMPSGRSRTGYVIDSNNYIKKNASIYVAFPFYTFKATDMSIEYSSNTEENIVTSVLYTLVCVNDKLSIKDPKFDKIFINGIDFTRQDGDSTTEAVYTYSNPNGIPWALDAYNIFHGILTSKSLKTYELYLDYEGRLFYFPTYDYNCEHPLKPYTFFENYPYEKFINRQFRWSAYSPDFMVKLPYYNQFFTGGKLTARVADISTPNYRSRSFDLDKTYYLGTEKDTSYNWPGHGLNPNNGWRFDTHLYNTHKYLLLEGNWANGKFRQYCIGNENLQSIISSKYEDIYCVSLTDSATAASTTNNKLFIFRASAGNALEAYRARYYYRDLSDTDVSTNGIKSWPWSGKSDTLVDVDGVGTNQRVDYSADVFNTSLVVRGKYSPYIGISMDTPTDPNYKDDNRYESTNYIGVGEIINIYIPGFKSEINTYSLDNINKDNISYSAIYQYLNIRMHDNRAYYAVSDRVYLDEEHMNMVCYRGDCYFSTYTLRINRNFQDPSAPTNDIVVDNLTWLNYGLGGELAKVADGTTAKPYHLLNSGDVNAAPLGSWITIKCCTNYNLSIRSVDDSHTSEKALTGLSRGFCPFNKPDMSASSKIPESETMNDGFNTTVGDKMYFTIEDSLYQANTFKNRIYYSNVSLEGAFTNGYRVVKSVNFRDFNPEYGSITKILSYNDNLLVVFEHAIGICLIYEKNLITENLGSLVYINSNNILPLKLTILSDTLGSQWQESVIKTPYFIYGIDTSTKKIWRVNDALVEIISDFKVESFLNKNIDISSKDISPYLGILNVKTHYNALKSEVMFTYYNNPYLFNAFVFNPSSKDLEIASHKFDYNQWNLAYNEINKCFTTFYSWIPSYSENIDNVYYSFDLNQTFENIFNYSDPLKAYLYRHGFIDLIKDNNQLIPKPCLWYDRLEPFEFEFTVRDDPSVLKIWNNLQIISNKAEPESFHFEITGESYEFKKDKPNIYYRLEATKELWHNLKSTIKYNKEYAKHAIPNYDYTISDRYTTESPYQTIGGVSKSTYFPLYFKRLKKGLDIEYSVSDSTHLKLYDWKYLSGSEIIYDDKTNSFNIATHIKCVPRSKYGTLRSNSDYIEDRWEVLIPLINIVLKNEAEWPKNTNNKSIPPLVIDYIPNDIKSSDIDFNKLPKDYKQLDYWPKSLDLQKWTSTKLMPIRDKYIKIRIRYNGTEKAIISAIKTIYTESFA